jgi:acyl carrier protein
LIDKDDKQHQDSAGAYQCIDEVFVSDLGLSFPSGQAETALAIRASIAELAGVPASSVGAHHTFADDLAGRGMFDDSLDSVEFVMTLEEQMGKRIPDEVAERLPGLNELDFPHPLYSVADFVTQMTRYLIDAGLVRQ